ncbi:pyridoxal 5'-phosphate synthase [Bernardetia sp.]|uniref:pyridoxine/pyridoxamine 5'-phosphate oxidase n=1 Tax=Bernardetia sp. TaxID=1937974 RepID=UPI0025BF3B1F|nr:pyridoxal 5'-phosphate synthase [Bernardetia sp.]
MSIKNEYISPIELFTKWFDEEKKISQTKHISAVCLSTLGLDGFPNARFVSLKEIMDENFVITTSFNSRKGLEISGNNKVALTFWWKTTERQIRIQGIATKTPTSLAQKYFKERNLASQIVSCISNQGQESNAIESLEKELEQQISQRQNVEVPADWGGYFISPVRIEFMQFKDTRFHDRKLYVKQENEWICKQLQP